MNKLLIALTLILTGCAQMPQTGVKYSVNYGDAEIQVENYTDNEVIEVDYVGQDGTKLTLKKKGVDNTSPVTVLGATAVQIGAQNAQAQIEMAQIFKALLEEYKSLKSLSGQ